MIKILGILFFILLPGVVGADDATPVVNPCKGTWILHYNVRWFVERKEDGLTLNIPTNATILDCRGLNSTLEEYLIGVKASIRCANSTAPQGGPYVQQVRIICD